MGRDAPQQGQQREPERESAFVASRRQPEEDWHDRGAQEGQPGGQEEPPPQGHLGPHLVASLGAELPQVASRLWQRPLAEFREGQVLLIPAASGPGNEAPAGASRVQGAP